MRTEEKNTFRTADLALAGALCASGFVIDEMERVSPTRSVFIFKDTTEIDTYVQQYWKGELMVEAQTFFNQLKSLKARIYER